MSDNYNQMLKSLQYRHPDRTCTEILRVIQQYRALVAKRGLFAFGVGRQKELVNIEGTIPVTYRCSTYHIPICIWLMDTHPDHAPICYVKPTPNMQINISHHVDHSGKIYAPYLHDWSANESDLLSLIQILIVLFGEKPPLFSVPTAAAASNTPYPTQASSYYMPMPGNAAPSLPYPVHSVHPAPPYPVADGNQSHAIRQSQPAYPPYPIPSSTSAQSPPAATGTITEQHIRVSLLSAAEEKVKRHLREYTAQAKAELDTLEKIQHELNQGKERLNHLTSKLESEQKEWEKILTTLRDKDAELDTALANLENQGELDVDEAVVTTAPLYKQLLKAFAEEAATEDAIYYLGEGLRRGVIDLDVFLKHVRSLSRKQFTLRALMHKCRNKAGLAC